MCGFFQPPNKSAVTVEVSIPQDRDKQLLPTSQDLLDRHSISRGNFPMQNVLHLPKIAGFISRSDFPCSFLFFLLQL